MTGNLPRILKARNSTKISTLVFVLKKFRRKKYKIPRKFMIFCGTSGGNFDEMTAFGCDKGKWESDLQGE